MILRMITIVHQHPAHVAPFVPFTPMANLSHRMPALVCSCAGLHDQLALGSHDMMAAYFKHIEVVDTLVVQEKIRFEPETILHAALLYHTRLRTLEDRKSIGPDAPDHVLGVFLAPIRTCIREVCEPALKPASSQNAR